MSRKYCPACDRFYDEDYANYCLECGAALTEVESRNRCSEGKGEKGICGVLKVADGDKYCKECGSPTIYECVRRAFAARKPHQYEAPRLRYEDFESPINSYYPWAGGV
jgi:hypothetical protein